MKILCSLGRHQYGRAELGEGIEYTAFLPALRRLGHEVLHFESWDRRAYHDFAELNTALLAVVASQRPDVVLTVQRDVEIWTETLDAIRTLGCLAVTWTTDDSWKYREVSRFIARHYDTVATTYKELAPRYKRDGFSNVHATQWAANHDWLREPTPSCRCRYDVTFVGAAYGQRRQMVQALGRRGVRVECFGDGWPRGPVAAAEIPAIMNSSRISLNFSDGFKPGGQRQIKARNFEVAGAGGLLLTESAPGLEDLYKIDSEILCFEDLDQMESKIRGTIAQPDHRDRIAMAGYLRTKADHTYERRLGDLLNAVLRSRANVIPSAEATSLGSAIERHRMTPALSGLRLLLLLLCRLIWRRRAARAARRVAFELSWRLCGERTFASSGLPGRLFPEL